MPPEKPYTIKFIDHDTFQEVTRTDYFYSYSQAQEHYNSTGLEILSITRA